MEALTAISKFAELGIAAICVVGMIALVYHMMKDHRQERDEYRKEREELRKAFREESAKSKEQHKRAMDVLDSYTNIIRDISSK